MNLLFVFSATCFNTKLLTFSTWLASFLGNFLATKILTLYQWLCNCKFKIISMLVTSRKKQFHNFSHVYSHKIVYHDIFTFKKLINTFYLLLHMLFLLRRTNSQNEGKKIFTFSSFQHETTKKYFLKIKFPT